MAGVETRFITEADGRPLRRDYLRPGLPERVYPAVPAIHGGAYDGSILIGSASLLREDLDQQGLTEGWRLRGMITHPDWRSRGVGALVLGFVMAEALRRGAFYVWCHGRSAALEFYRRQGFAATGDEFLVPGTGPHFIMLRDCRAWTLSISSSLRMTEL